MASRADLHVHSKYSDRPSEWILRRIGAPECYTEPEALYETAKRRGMQFVTISDHNCISGALEIAHLPDVFVSNEVTTYFPEDGCKIHVLCWNISETQFIEIQRLRRDIVDLRDYLHAQKIPHSCAHPLYRINDRLTLDHFEKLLLLFNVFETMNGGRGRDGNDLVLAILKSLDREQLENMANRHGIAPVGEQPWVKGFSGGSDDHSGAFIAKGFTECPDSHTPAEFLDHVARRRGLSGGLDGTPLSFAHSLYSIGYRYYRDRFLSKSEADGDLVLKVMGKIFGKKQTQLGLRDRVSYYANKIARRPERPVEIEFKRMISTEMVKLFGEDWLKDDFIASAERYEELNRRTFELSCKISNQLFFQFTKKFVKKLSAGSIFGSLEAMSAIGPILLGVAPYLFSFVHQSRDKEFLAQVSQHFLGIRSALNLRPKKAWFTDTLTEVNGVTTLVHKMCRLAQLHEHDLTLISFAGGAHKISGQVQNFKPVGQFTLPENETVTLAFPPFLDILEYCERRQLTELIISTPGLAGLAALAAGKMLNIRMVGIYHTDLPQYIQYYTEDDSLESAAWRYLRWFYEQMDVIYVPSRVYRQQLVAKGFVARKLHLFPHGTDVEVFHPKHRDPLFWETYGANGGPKITYIGRVAKEKDLDILIEVYEQLARRRPECTLTVVGDGPFLGQMRENLPYPNVVFTGFLFGSDLSRAYASSDIFVFPSTTDTFGNVVLEAMASGVPVIVSDKGGPREIVQHGRTGLVTKGRNATELLSGIERLLDNPELRDEMSSHCRSYAESRSWEKIYLDFWNGHDCDRFEMEGNQGRREEFHLGR
jgi:glycosyltransferase involved in cell wall biosynthesis